MIEINLLPEQMRSQSSKGMAAGGLNMLLLLVPLVAGILVVLHLFSGVIYLTRSSRLAAQRKQWQVLEPQRQTLAALKNSFASFSLEEGIIRSLLSESVSWSLVLNKLSRNLPPEMWFEEITIKPQKLTLSGSVVNLGKDELDTVNRFIGNLKADAEFMAVFSSFEPGPISRRVSGAYTVADFILYLHVKEAKAKK